MISVCIPVYNSDVRVLTGQLSGQLEQGVISGEILIYDDGSEEEFRRVNRAVADIKGVTYEELPENRGRSAIRNLLGRASAGSMLLFLDADSGLVDDRFLERYVKANERADVLCGGTIYPEAPPRDKSSLLRWLYGRKREQLTAARRAGSAKFAITANNFMIRKEVFIEHPFRESIREYGHEDTVLGYDLRKAGIEVVHVDNPVYHNGLETSSCFLKKSEAALDNLLYISENILTDPLFISGSKLLTLRARLRRWGFLSPAGSLFLEVRSMLERNLTGGHPQLFLFDLYRLGYLCSKP